MKYLCKTILMGVLTVAIATGGCAPSKSDKQKSKQATESQEETTILPRSMGLEAQDLVIIKRSDVSLTATATNRKNAEASKPVYYDIPLSHELQDWIRYVVNLVRERCKIGKLTGDNEVKILALPKEFDAEFILGNCRAESTYTRTLVNKKSGCTGYMQLTPKYFDLYFKMTVEQLGLKLEKDIKNAKTNFAVGIFWIATGFIPPTYGEKGKIIKSGKYSLTAEELCIVFANGPWGARSKGSSTEGSKKRMRYRQELLDGTYPTKYY